MHRAKHRAAGQPDAQVSVTDLVERFAVPGPRSVAVLDRPVEDPALFGTELYGGLADPVVPAPAFGPARHRACPTPRMPAPLVERSRPQPLGTAISVTVLGAAAAAAAVVVPAPTGIETTGSMAPVQHRVAPDTPAHPALAVPAAAPALPDQPTLVIHDLVSGVKAQMATEDKAAPTVAAAFTTVASRTELAAPAAMRKAALSNALGKIGTPYRWGAMGPNAFDCSGLVKWSFAHAGRNLPRTSGAMSRVGTPVSRANLQPGDLVFFYQPISHVGIYVGNNKIVHASQSGKPVMISDISRMRMTKAVRLA